MQAIPSVACGCCVDPLLPESSLSAGPVTGCHLYSALCLSKAVMQTMYYNALLSITHLVLRTVQCIVTARATARVRVTTIGGGVTVVVRAMLILGTVPQLYWQHRSNNRNTVVRIFHSIQGGKPGRWSGERLAASWDKPLPRQHPLP